MSKKETEFDRFARMRKLEKETEAQKRKSNDVFIDMSNNKKGGKSKSGLDFQKAKRGNWTKKHETMSEAECEYI